MIHGNESCACWSRLQHITRGIETWGKWEQGYPYMHETPWPSEQRKRRVNSWTLESVV